MATRKEQDEAAARKRDEEAARRRADQGGESTADQGGNPAEQGEDSSNPAGAPRTVEPPQGRVVGTRPNPGDANYASEHARASREAQQASEGGGAQADKDSNAAANANRSANSPNADATRQPGGGSSVTPMGTQDVDGTTPKQG